MVGIDNSQCAIDDARSNAELNGISNTIYVCGPAEQVLEGVLQVGVWDVSGAYAIWYSCCGRADAVHNLLSSCCSAS